mmetsp:Transcript_1882/g.5657  ORF Transcript_1882/g.5657 Transcript_1882/m.5657 type:complete len:224 (+) Transcript_1882:149-820(+)
MAAATARGPCLRHALAGHSSRGLGPCRAGGRATGGARRCPRCRPQGPDDGRDGGKLAQDLLQLLALEVLELLPDALLPALRQWVLGVLPVLQRAQHLLQAVQALVGTPQESQPRVGLRLATGQGLEAVHVLEAQLCVHLAHDREAGQGAVQPQIVQLLHLLPIVPVLVPPLLNLAAPLLKDVDLLFQLCYLVYLLEARQHAHHADLVDRDENQRGPPVTPELE